MARTSQASIDNKIAKLGLIRPIDFALWIPLRYEDETVITPISQAQPDLKQQFEGRIYDVDISYGNKKL